MKTLKGSFLALVAILAVGLTIAMQAGAFESKVARVNECYTSITTLDPTANCQQVSTNICESVVATRPIFSLGALFVGDPEQLCPGGDFLCCVKIVAAARQCPTQPQIDPAGAPALGFYQVASGLGSIYCKDTQN